MLTMIIFFLLFFGVFGSILKFAVKATWGIAKIILGLVVLPIVMISLLISGLLALAIPVLVILGIVFLVKIVAAKG